MGQGISGNCSPSNRGVPFICLSVSVALSKSLFFSASLSFNCGTKYFTGLIGRSLLDLTI